MNRRELFRGVVSTPAVGLALYSADGRAYMGGAHQCAECLSYMLNERTAQGVTLECSNERCVQFGVKYRYPMLELERA